MASQENVEKLITLIDKTIEESSNPIYALQDKFDICERIHDLKEMKKVIEETSDLKMRDSYGKDRALYREKVLYAAYKKDNNEIKKLESEIINNNIRINMEILHKKIEKIMNN